MLEVWNRPDWTSNNVTCVAYSAVNSTEFINNTVIIDAKGRLNKAIAWVTRYHQEQSSQLVTLTVPDLPS